MYVCICKAVTTRQIEAAIDAGVVTFAGLRAELGVSTCCGQCGVEVRQMLAALVGDEQLGTTSTPRKIKHVVAAVSS